SDKDVDAIVIHNQAGPVSWCEVIDDHPGTALGLMERLPGHRPGSVNHKGEIQGHKSVARLWGSGAWALTRTSTVFSRPSQSAARNGTKVKFTCDITCLL